MTPQLPPLGIHALASTPQASLRHLVDRLRQACFAAALCFMALLPAGLAGCGATDPADGTHDPADGDGVVDPIDFSELAKQHDIQVTEVSPGTYDFLIVRVDGLPVADYRFVWFFGAPANETREGATVRFPFPTEGEYEVVVSAFAPSLGEASRTQDRVEFALSLDMAVPHFGDVPPVAQAGSDVQAFGGETVCLDGSQSFDANGDPITFAWWQVSGVPVVLKPQADPAKICFVAPYVESYSRLVFGLRTSDQTGNTTDKVVVALLMDGSQQLAVDAGEEQVVSPGTLVTLRGATSGTTGAPVRYAWSQLSGTTVPLSADDQAETQFFAPLIAGTEETLTFQLEAEQTGQIASDVVVVKVQFGADPAELILYENFEELTEGENPPDWVATDADNSLSRSDGLFRVLDAGGDLALGTDSSETNIHMHYVGAGSAGWSGYEMTGRMMCDDVSGGLGVTFFSDFPNSDAYYRLRSGSFPGGEAFHVAPHGTTISGDTTTDVRPQAGVWYEFRIRVGDTDTGTQIHAKVWPASDAEPSDWQVDCYDDSDTRLSGGTVGVWSMGAGKKFWDDITAVAIPLQNGGDGGGGGSTPDDEDPCPGDVDLDGVTDCADGCPWDPEKTMPGLCGCSVPDVDANQNGTMDCLESSDGGGGDGGGDGGGGGDPQTPTLSVGQTTLNIGVGVNSVSFDVWNSGVGTLTYNLSESASWLTLSPAYGSSTGEHDTITATVNRSGLTQPSYSAEVTVTPNVGLPITIVVSLLMQTPSGPALTPAGRWDTVPFQRVEAGQTLKAGVVAFSKNGIREVRFSISGQGYSGTNPKVANSMTYNDQTNVWEYWVPISASEFTGDGAITVEATVIGNDGGLRDKNTRPGDGLEALTLYVNPRGTLAHNIAWVDGSSGNDGTGAVNNSGKPYQSIAKAMKAIETYQGGKADGGEVRLRSGNYVMDGNNNWNGGNANVVNEWITVRSDTSAGATSANTRITGVTNGSLSANRLKVQGLTLAAPDIIRGTVSGSHLWLQDCDLPGGSGSSPFPVASNWSGPQYFTECRIANQRRASGFAATQKIMRNLTIQSTREDCFQNVPFGVNIFVTGSDPGSGASPEHADVVQGWGGAPQNWIWYNVVAKDLHYQGIFIRSGDTAYNNAFVNCMLEMRDPIRLDPGDGRGSDFAGKFDHLILWNCTFIGTPSRNNVTLGIYESATSPPNQFLMKNVSVRGCLFTDFRSYVSAADKNWVNNADVTFQDNHYINYSPAYNGLIPGTGKTQGDPKVQKSTSSADLGRPLSGSPLLNRISPPLVPADAFGRQHGSSAPVGALAP